MGLGKMQKKRKNRWLKESREKKPISRKLKQEERKLPKMQLRDTMKELQPKKQLLDLKTNNKLKLIKQRWQQIKQPSKLHSEMFGAQASLVCLCLQSTLNQRRKGMLTGLLLKKQSSVFSRKLLSQMLETLLISRDGGKMTLITVLTTPTLK